MNTMKKLSYYLTVLLFAVVVSCSDKNEFTTTDTSSVQGEATTDAYFEDTDDIATQAVAADPSTTSGARESSMSERTEGARDGVKPVGDTRFTCATVTFEFAANDNTQAIPHGYITIDFGTTGCTDARGNVRKGKIKIEFKGKKFLPGSTVTTTLDGYYINGVKIEGTRTVTIAVGSSLDHPKFNVAITGGKATWPDATFATREAHRTVTVTGLVSGDLTVTQMDGFSFAGGTNRDGKTYEVSITSPLVYSRSCAISSKVFIPVRGTKVLTTASKTITIDYGDGTCDKTVTMTSNSKSREVTVGGDI